MKLDKKSNAAAKSVAAAKEANKNNKTAFVKMISTDDLLDNPKNAEDITETADLEASIKEIGFVDPIDVTPFGAPDGKYMIVSGHRRRASGVKLGMKEFPCLVHDFQSDADVENWLLFLNNYRDSSKDPLLYMRRCQAAKAYLENTGFKGNLHEEISRRLGISRKTVFAYLALGKLITPIQQLVRDDAVGMTSVQPVAQFDPVDQAQIHEIMLRAQEETDLTRALVKTICDRFAEGARTWKEISAVQPHKIEREPLDESAPDPEFAGLGVNQTFATPESSSGEKERDRNDEVRRQFDPIAAEQDKMDQQQKSYASAVNKEPLKWDGQSNKDLVESAFRQYFRTDDFDAAASMNVSDLTTAIRKNHRGHGIGGLDFKKDDTNYCVNVDGQFDKLLIRFTTLEDWEETSYRLTWLAAAKFLKSLVETDADTAVSEPDEFCEQFDDEDAFKNIALGYMVATLDAMQLSEDVIQAAKAEMLDQFDELDAVEAREFASKY